MPVLAALALSIGPAIAPPIDAPGPRVTLAASFAAPYGGVDQETRVRDAFTTQLVLDGGVAARMSRAFQLGVFAAIGVGPIVRDQEAECRARGSSCTGSTFRLGLRGELALAPARWSSPWIAASVAYENAKISGEAEDLIFKLSVRGIEGALAAGADIRISEVARFGPFVSASLGRYFGGVLGTRLSREGVPIEERQIHGWIQVGLRMTIAPGRAD
jgi:hypothetical protein